MAARERSGGERRPAVLTGDDAVEVPEEFPDELIDELLAGARTGEQITGPDGLLNRLTKRLVERSLAAELTDHLGYEHGEAPPLRRGARGLRRSGRGAFGGGGVAG